LISNREVLRIARQVVPPDYLQEEVEENLVSGIEYLKGEQGTLNLEINL